MVTIVRAAALLLTVTATVFVLQVGQPVIVSSASKMLHSSRAVSLISLADFTHNLGTPMACKTITVLEIE